MVSILITQRNGKVFLVFNNGRKNVGVEVPDMAFAEKQINFIVSKRPVYYRLKTPLVNMDEL